MYPFGAPFPGLYLPAVRDLRGSNCFFFFFFALSSYKQTAKAIYCINVATTTTKVLSAKPAIFCMFIITGVILNAKQAWSVGGRGDCRTGNDMNETTMGLNEIRFWATWFS